MTVFEIQNFKHNQRIIHLAAPKQQVYIGVKILVGGLGWEPDKAWFGDPRISF